MIPLIPIVIQILTFIRTYSKIFIIGSAVVVGSIFLYKLYDIVQTNGELRSILSVQEETIKNKNEQIDTLEKTIKLNEDIIEEKEKDIETLSNALENITKDLGDDSNDAAPDSIKELFRRLEKQ